MESVIVAYCTTHEQDFERTIPLKFLGERNRKLGLSNDIHILFTDGYHRLSSSYKQSLKNLGFTLHDTTKLYTECAQKYPQLDQHFTNYSKNTYLQWLVIDEFFQGTPIIDYDGDIVFNEDPAVIAKLVAGKTFILQGCPAFTVVSDREWFRQYRDHLNQFLHDMDGYAERAWQQREGWEVTFKTRWAGSRFSKLFLHDQDLMSHLIHTGQLIQDPVEDLLHLFKDYMIFENPLFIHFYDDNFPYTYHRENGIDYFYFVRNDACDIPYRKKVLFWHMQNCFNFYASKYLLRKKLFPMIPLGRVNLDLCGKGFEDTLNKKLRRFMKHTSRLSVYKYFFEQSDFSGLLSDSKWWKKGIFK